MRFEGGWQHDIGLGIEMARRMTELGDRVSRLDHMLASSSPPLLLVACSDVNKANTRYWPSPHLFSLVEK